jgi:hypothetical protein
MLALEGLDHSLVAGGGGVTVVINNQCWFTVHIPGGKQKLFFSHFKTETLKLSGYPISCLIGTHRTSNTKCIM